MSRQPPTAPPNQCKDQNQKPDPRAFHAGCATHHNPAILHVFCECHPFHIRRIGHAIFPAALFKAPHPGLFLQAQGAQVTP